MTWLDMFAVALQECLGMAFATGVFVWLGYCVSARICVFFGAFTGN